MRDPITIFTASTGLNTVAEPLKIAETDLQVAVNITIDQVGMVERRKGFTLLQLGDYHSLFCDKGDCFVINSDSLYQVGADGSLRLIRSGLTPNALMDFIQVGFRTYYVNGYEFGWIEDGVSNIWETGTYVGPTTNVVFSGPMPGQHIAQSSGRVFISTDNVLWWSELFDFGLFNRSESFIQFHTTIRMIKPTAGGMFISTDRNTYFTVGLNPMTWILNKVASFPAIEWSAAIEPIEGTDIGLSPGLCVVWASKEGAILGTPEGQIINLTKDKIIYPDDAKTGFGCFIGYQFLHGLE